MTARRDILEAIAREESGLLSVLAAALVEHTEQALDEASPSQIKDLAGRLAVLAEHDAQTPTAGLRLVGALVELDRRLVEANASPVPFAMCLAPLAALLAAKNTAARAVEKYEQALIRGLPIVRLDRKTLSSAIPAGLSAEALQGHIDRVLARVSRAGAKRVVILVSPSVLAESSSVMNHLRAELTAMGAKLELPTVD